MHLIFRLTQNVWCIRKELELLISLSLYKKKYNVEKKYTQMIQMTIWEKKLDFTSDTNVIGSKDRANILIAFVAATLIFAIIRSIVFFWRFISIRRNDINRNRIIRRLLLAVSTYYFSSYSIHKIHLLISFIGTL